MNKISSVFNFDPSNPADKRQARLLVAVLCGVYAMAAAGLLVTGTTQLPQAVIGFLPPDKLPWGIGFIVLGILLAVTALGLWRFERWAVVCSVLLLTAALIYSGAADIQRQAWLSAFVKLLVIPAVAAGHVQIWKAAQA